MQTLGEYRVGVEFNPSGDENVAHIKQKAADLIDYVNHIDQADPEVRRLVELALDHIEDAAMWAVKAVTKRPR